MEEQKELYKGKPGRPWQNIERSPQVKLSEKDRNFLQENLTYPFTTTAQKQGHALLMLNEGKKLSEVAAKLDVSPSLLSQWASSYRKEGLEKSDSHLYTLKEFTEGEQEPVFKLKEGEEGEIEGLLTTHSLPYKVIKRLRILLDLNNGRSLLQTAIRWKVSGITIINYLNDYRQGWLNSVFEWIKDKEKQGNTPQKKKAKKKYLHESPFKIKRRSKVKSLNEIPLKANRPEKIKAQKIKSVPVSKVKLTPEDRKFLLERRKGQAESLRDKWVNALLMLDEGKGISETALELKISSGSVSGWAKRYRKQGALTGKKLHGQDNFAPLVPLSISGEEKSYLLSLQESEDSSGRNHNTIKDKRIKLLLDVSEGKSIPKAAEGVGVGYSTAYNWVEKYKKEGRSFFDKGKASPLVIKGKDKAYLLSLYNQSPQDMQAKRAKALLMLSEGQSNEEIEKLLNIKAYTVKSLEKSYRESGLDSIKNYGIRQDRPGRHVALNSKDKASLLANQRQEIKTRRDKWVNALLLLDEGKTITYVSSLLGLNAATIRNWAQAYRTDGLKSKLFKAKKLLTLKKKEVLAINRLLEQDIKPALKVRLSIMLMLHQGEFVDDVSETFHVKKNIVYSYINYYNKGWLDKLLKKLP